jgi:hypothetical protein
MPSFFVPAARDDAQAEEVWEATRKFARDQLGWEVGERRIFRIEYTHDGQDLVAQVGEQEPRQGEPVLVILESNAYLVCTENRGVARGAPILVGLQTVSKIVDFDA